jgi:hypothetical protein
MFYARRFAFAALILVAVPWTAQAGVAVGVGVRFGGPCYRPCYPYRVGVGVGFYFPGPYYYGPPVYVAPAPVVVAPTAVVAQPVAAAAPATPTSAASPEPPLAVPKDPSPLPPPTPLPTAGEREVEDLIRQVNTGDDRARAEAAVQLGKLKASRGVGPLIRLLREDRSPAVREAAARGLGLIGETNALAALQNAAQADDDRDVRHSASFAADVIRSRLR